MTRRDAGFLVATIIGIVAYVATWATLGALAEGYDPLRQAISELFDLGTPRGQRLVLQAVLVVTGLALLPVGPVLDRVLPGEGRSGPLLAIVAGVGTVAVAFFPCTDGCPGVGTTFTDTMHTVLAGIGYVGLITAPLAFAWRLRTTAWRDLALAGLVLGGVATVGFLARNLGVDALGGLQQRIFNTAADAWYVVAAVVALRRRQVVRSTPERHSSSAQRTP